MLILRTRLSRSVLMTAALVLLATATSLATVVAHANLAKLAKLADVIVDVTVESKRTELESSEGAIWTIYELRATETLAGAKRESLTVHVPGGATAGLTQEISGTAHLDVGERAILFLTKEDGHLLVLGQSQGCFRVTQRAATSRTRSGKIAADVAKNTELVCRNNLSGLALVADDGKGVAAEPIEVTLTELRAKVKATVVEKAAALQRRRDAADRRLAALRKRARRNREHLRGKPGGGE